MESAAKTGNLKSMYAGIKTAMVPTIKEAPLKSKDGVTLTKRAGQMNRWIEHFSDLYDTERPYTAPVVDKFHSWRLWKNLTMNQSSQRWRLLSPDCQITKLQVEMQFLQTLSRPADKFCYHHSTVYF